MTLDNAKRLHAHFVATKQVAQAKELELKHPELKAKPKAEPKVEVKAKK